MDWNSLDWSILDRLRAAFLSAAQPGVSYWTSREDLAQYDFTFGQRIGWKWDAVLAELSLRRWAPPVSQILDWGCGSGIAGRRVVEYLGGQRICQLQVYDQSAVAMEFAMQAARETFAGLEVRRADVACGAAEDSVGLLVVSHVLNELSPAQRQQLLRVAGKAAAVIWIEPGTFADSRELIAVREALRDQFAVVAPCTHQASCGLLAPGNERHWCHHFAAPPKGIMANSNWVRFAQRAGIDLRSLPYSFLVLEQKELRASTAAAEVAPVPVAGCSRIIGRPRVYKPYARIFSCQEDGVRDLMLQKRDHPALFKTIKQGRQGSLYRWEVSGDRIRSAAPLAST